LRRLPPLNALRAFEAAARHTSFQAAAAELNVTPAAVSHQIKALEEHLGVPLFKRLNREVRLTDAGRACLPGLRDGFDRIAEAVESIRPGRGGGILTVSAAPSIAGKWLLPRIDGFRTRHPEIDVRIDAAIQTVDFSRADVDVALRYGAGRYPGLYTELLMRTEVFPVCAPELTRGKTGLKSPADLRHHTLIHEDEINPDPSCPTWAMWLRAAGVQDVDASRGIRLTQATLVMDAVLAGRGVALAKSVAAADDLASGRVVRPFGEGVLVDFAYYFVCPPASLEIAKVKAFKRWIFEEAK